MKYIVSACLAGVACRYDGKHSRHEDVVRLVREGRALPACPEQLGGLPTPRPPAEFRQGDGRSVLMGEATVIDHAGRLVTEQYLCGSIEFFRIAKTFGAGVAVLKDRSPACGLQRVYIDGKLKSGRGVTAALLEAEGLKLLAPSSLSRKGRTESVSRP